MYVILHKKNKHESVGQSVTHSQVSVGDVRRRRMTDDTAAAAAAGCVLEGPSGSSQTPPTPQCLSFTIQQRKKLKQN